MPQAAGQVKIFIFLVKIKFSPYMPIFFCDAGQVPILRYFEAGLSDKIGLVDSFSMQTFSLPQRKHTRPQTADVSLDLCNRVYRLDLQNIG